MVERVVQWGLDELEGQGMCVGRCGVAEEAGFGLYVEEGTPQELEGKRKVQAAMSVPRPRCLEGQEKTLLVLLLYSGYKPFAFLIGSLQVGRAVGVPDAMLSRAVGALVSYRFLRLGLGETSVRLVVAAANAAKRQFRVTGLVVPKVVASEAPQWLGSVGT